MPRANVHACVGVTLADRVDGGSGVVVIGLQPGGLACHVLSARTAAIATAGERHQSGGRLRADEVLEHMLKFTSLLDLLPSTDEPAIHSIDAAVAPLTHSRFMRGTVQ